MRSRALVLLAFALPVVAQRPFAPADLLGVHVQLFQMPVVKVAYTRAIQRRAPGEARRAAGCTPDGPVRRGLT